MAMEMRPLYELAELRASDLRIRAAALERIQDELSDAVEDLKRAAKILAACGDLLERSRDREE